MITNAKEGSLAELKENLRKYEFIDICNVSMNVFEDINLPTEIPPLEL
jgi:hypothetical protein